MAKFVMIKVVGDVIQTTFVKKNYPQNYSKMGGGVKKLKFLHLDQTLPNFIHIICGPLGG